MKKNKTLGILMISSASILIILIVAYTIIFSKFGLISGGSFLMLIPLLIIAITLIIGLSFLFLAGIRKIKN